MAINFPNSPSTNDTFVAAGSRWLWNGTAWVRQGSPGSQGVQGATGATGPQGNQGVQGATGAGGPGGSAGPTGPQGDDGAAGPQGNQGVQGATGSTGPQGNQGVQGATGAGGPSGSTGPTGPQGNQGVQGAAAAGANGKILQVVHVEKTDVFSANASNGSFSTIFSASITPSSTSNKILVMWNSNLSLRDTGQRAGFRMLRGSTVVNVGDTLGSRVPAGVGNLRSNATNENIPASQMFLDSPSSTSSVTYNLQVGAENGAVEIFVGRSENNTNSNTYYTMASNIVLMEVAA